MPNGKLTIQRRCLIAPAFSPFAFKWQPGTPFGWVEPVTSGYWRHRCRHARLVRTSQSFRSVFWWGIGTCQWPFAYFFSFLGEVTGNTGAQCRHSALQRHSYRYIENVPCSGQSGKRWLTVALTLHICTAVSNLMYSNVHTCSYWKTIWSSCLPRTFQNQFCCLLRGQLSTLFVYVWSTYNMSHRSGSLTFIPEASQQLGEGAAIHLSWETEYLKQDGVVVESWALASGWAASCGRPWASHLASLSLFPHL